MSLDQPKPEDIDGSPYTFGVVAARFNQRYVDGLLSRARETLESAGAKTGNIHAVRVPGSNEVPYALSLMAREGRFHALIGLGLVLAGETNHHDVIGYETAGVMHTISLQFNLPVINGIVVVNSEEQAEARCLGSLNRGGEFAQAALEMARIREQWL